MTLSASVTDQPTRLRVLYERLLETYGPQKWWPAKTSLEVVIGAYLTQNTAWTSVGRSLRNLEINHLLTIDGLRLVPEEELRTHIRPSGYMVRKAAAIKAFVAFLDNYYEGSLENLADESPGIARSRLLALPGVGPETADAILLYALRQPAVVVDEYLRRVITRHGLLPLSSKYSDIQQLAIAAFANDSPAARRQHFNEFHAVIVQVGKNHCGRVPRCETCPLRFDLPHPLRDTSTPRRSTAKSKSAA
jgi:endonuclease III related protein